MSKSKVRKLPKPPKTAYTTLWRAKWLADGCKTLSAMAKALRDEAARLDRMDACGIRLDGEVEDDYGTLVTTDPEVAEKFSFGLEDLDDE